MKKLVIRFCCYYLLVFSLNTPPGTKVKLLGIVQVRNGLLLLDDSKISVLGGEVDHMVEKWELQRVRSSLVMVTQLLVLKKKKPSEIGYQKSALKANTSLLLILL